RGHARRIYKLGPPLQRVNPCPATPEPQCRVSWKRALRYTPILCIGGGARAARRGGGLVAEWLRRGLQILPSRFDSGRGLQTLVPALAACSCRRTKIFDL